MAHTSATPQVWTLSKKKKITSRQITSLVRPAKITIMVLTSPRFQTITKCQTCHRCSTSSLTKSKTVFTSLSESETTFQSGISQPHYCQGMCRPCRLPNKKRIYIQLSKGGLGLSCPMAEVTFQNLSGKLIHTIGSERISLQEEPSMRA